MNRRGLFKKLIGGITGGSVLNEGSSIVRGGVIDHPMKEGDQFKKAEPLLGEDAQIQVSGSYTIYTGFLR